jgi:enterochelin esterase family protein
MDLKDRPIRTWWDKDGTGNVVSHEFKEPVCGVVALNGSTVLVADAADRYIWAIQVRKDGGIMGPGDRYCRLRVRGDDRRTRSTPPEAYRADPSAMIVDGASRTYVATNLGIQVFDPTGRLCGVMTAPPGRATELAFDGDRLFARADGKAFVRKMLAEGKK